MCEYKYFCENIFVQLLYKIKKKCFENDRSISTYSKKSKWITITIIA